MTRDTQAIIIAIIMATVAIIGINKSDIAGLRAEFRTELRELRGLLITHITEHSHHSHAEKIAATDSEESEP